MDWLDKNAGRVTPSAHGSFRSSQMLWGRGAYWDFLQEELMHTGLEARKGL